MTDADRSAAPTDFRIHADALAAHVRTWTHSALFAQVDPQGIALHSERGQRTYAQLHARAESLAHAMRALGLRPGDAVALMCRNRPEFVEVLLACLRSGLRLTPIATQLTADETAYIVRDCEARLLFVEPELAGIAVDGVDRIGIGTAGYDALALGPAAPFEGPVPGTLMLYTSGTTGRPKGVLRRTPEFVPPQFAGSFADYRPGDVQLCAGPAYHAAPLLFDLRWPLASGVPIVLVERFDAAGVLERMARHRVTHAHMVPTMFQRLLALPAAERARHDLSALRFVVHGAAPCPVAVKRALIDWWGPVVTEYYAATEGGDGIHIGAADWLRKPGAVGRFNAAAGHRLLDDDGRDVAPGQVGTIYFAAPAAGRFEYFKDPEKTAAAYRDDRFTLGDLGRVDDEGWLYLTGRGADTIISGGVNIYPREVDDVLVAHPAVDAVCTVGAPDDDWGERVVSVVVPAAGHAATPELAAALIGHAAQRLAGFKRPREIVFAPELPHSATGKLLRAQVRARFWAGRAQQI